jgi:hypothetical protein
VRLAELFGDRVSELTVTPRYADFVHYDVPALFELFRQWFGPVATLWASLAEPRRAEFAEEWIALAQEFNSATDGTCAMHSDYLEVTAIKT